MLKIHFAVIHMWNKIVIVFTDDSIDRGMQIRISEAKKWSTETIASFSIPGVM